MHKKVKPGAMSATYPTGFRGAGGLGPGQVADDVAEVTVDEFGGNGHEGPARRGEEGGSGCGHKKKRQADRAAAVGLEGLIVPHSSCKNQGIRWRHLVCYTDATHGPQGVIGVGLCRKVNCSDYTA